MLLGRVDGELLGALALDVAEVEVAVGIDGDAMDPVEGSGFGVGRSAVGQGYAQEGLALGV